MKNSLLDNDLYKFSMQNAFFHKCPNVDVKYEFKCRNKGIDFSSVIDKIKMSIEFIRQTVFNVDELNYLQETNLFKKDFIDFLFKYKNNYNKVDVFIENGELQIIVEGNILYTTLLEVPILATVNEEYFESNNSFQKIGLDNLYKKIKTVKENNDANFKFVDFGTRRRFSMEWHKTIVSILKEELPENFIGTSNVLFAREFNLKPIGTFAHEYVMLHQVLNRVEDSQKAALQNWADEYRGKLAIALSDTFGIDAFLRDFDLYFAKLYDGIRQDSGNPSEVAEKVINHYEKLGIDPKTKTIVFSDGLTIDSAIELHNKFNHRIKVVSGIGTSLTNDVGLEPLQIVMKLTQANGKPVAKISESRSKTMCNDQVYLNYLKSVFAIV